MLTQVLSNLMPALGLCQNPFSTTLKQIALNRNSTYQVKATQRIKPKEPHNGNLSLKSPDMCPTLNLTKDWSIPSALSPFQLKISSNEMRKRKVKPRKRNRQQTKKKNKAKKVKQVISRFMLSWKILSGIIINKKGLHPLPSCHHN